MSSGQMNFCTPKALPRVPAPPSYSIPVLPTPSDDQLNAQADIRYRSQLRDPPAPPIPAEDDDTPDDDPFEKQTPT